ncbi:MAG: diaminopimelate epimerase [Pseudomonadota bacterium]
MRLDFAKMHGLGNDFMVIDATAQAFALGTDQIRALSDRRTGVGFDQLLVVEPPSRDGVEFDYRIFNADGLEVEQCGNGARCFAVFVTDRGLTDSARIPVHTSGGTITLERLGDGRVVVDMGVPDFSPGALPFRRELQSEAYTLDIDGESIEFGAVSVGNPHAVIRVPKVVSAPVITQGPKVEHHADFPRRVNVGFLQIDGRDRAALRVWERGVGETRACGTGACAAMVVARARGWVDDDVTVSLPGGDLQIRWAGEGTPVTLTGPASFVFNGHVEA